MKHQKFNRYQKRTNREALVKEALTGTGLYVFENTTKGNLSLPKPTATGVVWIKPGGQFEGDSYYNMLIGSGLKLVRTITTPHEKAIMEQKLILDQPDKVTTQGTVEHVQVPKPLNEVMPTKPKTEILINEDPMDGVEILLN